MSLSRSAGHYFDIVLSDWTWTSGQHKRWSKCRRKALWSWEAVRAGVLLQYLLQCWATPPCYPPVSHRHNAWSCPCHFCILLHGSSSQYEHAYGSFLFCSKTIPPNRMKDQTFLVFSPSANAQNWSISPRFTAGQRLPCKHVNFGCFDTGVIQNTYFRSTFQEHLFLWRLEDRIKMHLMQGILQADPQSRFCLDQPHNQTFSV